MMDEMNLAPVPQELLTAEQEKDLLESREDREMARWEGAIVARQESRRQAAQARSTIRSRPLLLPPRPLSRARGRR